MLVMLTEEQILLPEQVCQGCVLASESGSPRWHRGKLGCGQSLGKRGKNQPPLYECQMGFRVAQVE